VGGRRSLEAAVGLPTQFPSPANPLVLLVFPTGLAGVVMVYGIRTRSGGGGLVASAIRPGPSAIAPDPVAVALDSGRLLANVRTVRLRVVVVGHRRLSERRRGEQRESRRQDHLLHDVHFPYAARTIPCRLTQEFRSRQPESR